MSRIAREMLNQREYLVVELEEGEYLDEDCLAAVACGQEGKRKPGIEGILPIGYTQFEGRRLTYDVNAYVPFAEYKRRIRGAEALRRVLLSVLDVYGKAGSHLLDPDCFLLEQEYVYVDETTGRAWLTICPVYDGEGRVVWDRRDFPGLFREMLQGIGLQEKDMAFYGSLLYKLNSGEPFHIEAFRRFLTEKENRKPDMPEQPVQAGPAPRTPVRTDSVQRPPVRPDPLSEPFVRGDSESDLGLPEVPPKQKGGFFGGIFKGNPGKAEKPGKSEKPERKKPEKLGRPEKGKLEAGRRGSIRLPDEEELPEIFRDEKKAEQQEEHGGRKNADKKDAVKKERTKREKIREKAVAVMDILPTDDMSDAIPPTDDGDFDEPRTVRRLYLKRCDTGETVLVRRFPFEVGREGSGLTVDASMTQVSRQHAVIIETEEGFAIRDISKLGTFLDGERIAKGEAVPLSDGVRIRFKEIDYFAVIEERTEA